MEKSERKKWVLQKIELEYQRYGDDKGKYNGRIHFQNDDYESFKFNLDDEMCERYMDLIRSSVIKTTQELGDKLAESIQLKDYESVPTE